MTDVTGGLARRHAWWAVPCAAAAAVGALTLLAHEFLPPGADVVGNSSAVWLAFAFWIGARSRDVAEGAVVAGLGLLGVVLVYYASLVAVTGRGEDPDVLLVWALAGGIGGPVFGALGRLARAPGPAVAGLAAAALGAVFVAEAFVYARFQAEPVATSAEVAVGLVLPVLVGRDWRARLAGLAAVTPLAIAAAAALRLVDGLLGRVA